MSLIVILYHSQSGHTEQQAQAVARGIDRVQGAQARLMKVDQVEERAQELDDADAIIFGSPTFMGSLSAEMKRIFEWSSGRWAKGLWRNKIAAGFSNSGAQAGDKLHCLMSMLLFAMQHGMIWVGMELLPGNNNSKGSMDDLNRLGVWLGAAAQSNIDQGPEIVPPPSDLQTAEHLGTRVAEITNIFKR